MSRYGGGNSGEPANIKKPLVFGKNAYHLWITLCVMAGMSMISLMLIWIVSAGGF